MAEKNKDRAEVKDKAMAENASVSENHTGMKETVSATENNTGTKEAGKTAAHGLNERLYYLDNIRFITVILVMIYHVIYAFNSQGVLSNFPVQGYPVLDNFLFVVYPWFMALLFVVAGISARFSLQKRSGKQFAKDRALRLILTSTVMIITLGWSVGSITNYYSNIFGENAEMIPGVIKYIIYSISGIGPLWFAQELFLSSMILLLIRAIDRKRRLEELCTHIKWWGFLILFVTFFASSYLFNTPIIEVYRNGFYTCSFLFGYYIFSQKKVMDSLSKAAKFLVPAAIVSGIGYVVFINLVICPQVTDDILTSVNYCSMSTLKHPFTNIYAFVAILAILSIGPKYLNFNHAFSRYMTKANFGFYALHYFAMAWSMFLALEVLKLPIWACYLCGLFGMILITTILYEIIRRIPGIKTIYLGIETRRRK